MEPEDVIYLLFNKELPSEEQSKVFKSDLASRTALPDGTRAVLASLPKDGHPMDWLSIGIHTLGMLDGKDDWKEDSLTSSQECQDCLDLSSGTEKEERKIFLKTTLNSV